MGGLQSDHCTNGKELLCLSPFPRTSSLVAPTLTTILWACPVSLSNQRTNLTVSSLTWHPDLASTILECVSLENSELALLSSLIFIQYLITVFNGGSDAASFKARHTSLQSITKIRNTVIVN